MNPSTVPPTCTGNHPTDPGLTYGLCPSPPSSLTDYTHVRQGRLGDCHLIASIAALVARRPDAVTSLFSANTPPYTLMFPNGGKSITVVGVDACLPIDKNKVIYAGRGYGAGAAAQGLWASYIEKAAAMHFGGYSQLSGTNPKMGADASLQLLCRPPAERIDLSQASNEVAQAIQEAWKRHCPMIMAGDVEGRPHCIALVAFDPHRADVRVADSKLTFWDQAKRKAVTLTVRELLDSRRKPATATVINSPSGGSLTLKIELIAYADYKS